MSNQHTASLLDKHPMTDLKRLFQSVSDIIFELDNEGRYLAIYGKWLTEAHLDESFFIGRFVSELFGEETAFLHEQSIKTALNGTNVTYTWTYTRQDKLYYFETKLSPIYQDETIIGVIGIARDMTKATLLNQELNDKERYLQRIIDGTQVATWQWNVLTGETKFDDRWVSMLGYTRSELEPLSIDTWKQLTHPDDLAKAMTMLQRVFEKKLPYYDIEIRMKHKKGHYIWIHDRGNVFSWTTTNQPAVMFGTHYEITERKEMQEALKSSHDLLSYIIEHDLSNVAVFDNSMNYLYVSDQFKTHYQINDNHLIGKNHYEVFPDIPKRWRDIHKRALAGEILSDDEDVFVRSNGRVEITKWACRPWYQADGSIGGMILYSEVINKHIELVKELEETQGILQAVMKHVPIGIAVIDFSDDLIEITYMNDLFSQIYCTTKETLQRKGHFFESIYENPVQREMMQKRIVSDVLSGDAKKMIWESIPIERNGSVVAYVTAYSSIIPNSKQLITTVIDVTEQHQKQSEIEYISYHDYLTNLYNRRFFVDTLDEIRDYPIGIMMMDVNGLKLINDAYGHEAGDDVLRSVADAMRECIDHHDIPCRIGGDEFAIIVPHATSDRMDSIKDSLKIKIQALKIHHIPLSIAIGYEIKSSLESNSKDTIKIAENIMYKRKLVEGRSMRNHAIQGILRTLTDKYIDEKTHSERVSQICQAIGNAMGMNKDDIQELKMAGLLHDIGKISIPDAILDKPSSLTQEEYAIIKTHPEISYQILRAADEYSDLATYALSHHERFDGKGYPKGLMGEKIPLFSRIIAVADAYEAMTANRPYRKALSSSFAQSELQKNANTQFDGSIVTVFLSVLTNQPNL